MSKENKGKGKDETKVINLMRFAYDIFRYSALKFSIQSQSIAEWEGLENDYGCSDFILVVSRLVLKHQIFFRNQLNVFFRSHFEPHMRNSLKHISELSRKVIILITMDPDLDIITHVEYSLVALCELILFLYSENSNFFLMQLTELWFQFYLKPNKTKFKKKGALNKMYKKGKEMQRDLPDTFINTFINVFGSNYRMSVQHYLIDKYYDSMKIYKQKHDKKPSEASVEIDLPRYIYLSVQHEDAGVNLPPNPLLGVAPPNEMYDFPLAGDEPLSQNIPEENVQDLSKRSKRQSYKERKQNRRPRSRSSMEQDHGQLSPDPSTASGTTQSYELQGARPKDSVQSIGLQTGESSLCSSGAERFGRLSLGSSRTKGNMDSKSLSVVKKYSTPSERLLETRIQAQLPLGLPKSIGSSETQDIEQLSSDSSVLKQSSGEKSNILEKDDVIFLENPDENPQEPTKEQSESSREEETEEKDIQNLPELSSDSSVLKQSSGEKSNILEKDDVIFLGNPDENPQVPTKEQSESSSEEETEEKNTQNLPELSSDSSVLKQSSGEKSNILEKDDVIFLGNPDENPQGPTKEQSESSSEEETEEKDIQEE